MSITDFLIGILGGLLLGGIFFGGLLYTVRHLSDWQYPKSILLASFAGRSLGALVGFYLLMQWSLSAMFVALIGFFLVRIYFTRREAPAESLTTQQS
ncbi:MAG: ATP synthase subunit I [Bacteroidota bacterium]